MQELKAPIAALFWSPEKETGRPTAMMALRMSVSSPICVPLGCGLYAVFAPVTDIVVDTTQLVSVLPEFEGGQCFFLTFTGVQAQAMHPVLCPVGALVQPSEVRIAQNAEFSRLVAKEYAMHRLA